MAWRVAEGAGAFSTSIVEVLEMLFSVAVMMATSPGGRGGWHSVGLDSHNYPTNAGGLGRRLLTVACAPKSVCLTGDAAGRVFSSAG